MKLASIQIIADSAQDDALGPSAEGIVVRPVEEARRLIGDSGRLLAKVPSERRTLKAEH